MSSDSKKSSSGLLSQEQEAAWPLWKLSLVALPQLGVQVMWCFIGPLSAPYMKHLGLPDYLATLNNIAGPITGFFTGPLVGAASDSCTSKYGRRRPIIVVGLVSTWVAGLLFASSEHLLPRKYAALFAAPMYWVMDVTVNVLQTPHRALVTDLASEKQQVPMQVVFVFMMAIGNFLGFTIMGSIYTQPEGHMLELMVLICVINTLCIGVQFMVAEETPLQRGLKGASAGPVRELVTAVRGTSGILAHLAVVQCMVWIGNTAWNLYSKQWFEASVYQGNADAPANSTEAILAQEANTMFTVGGQCKSALQLVAALVIIWLLMRTRIPPRLLYAPCIFIGALVSMLAAFAVGHNGAFATACLAASVMPEAGSFAIPFGLVAILNKKAEEKGDAVSTALMMALLNCCVTVGQQVCTLALSSIEYKMGNLEAALPCVFMLAAGAQLLGGSLTCALDDSATASRDVDPTGRDGTVPSEEHELFRGA